MLRDLFEGTGVMSAMDHSKIEGANDPEALSVDAQAAKVAKRAADAIRRSRAEVQVEPRQRERCCVALPVRMSETSNECLSG